MALTLVLSLASTHVPAQLSADANYDRVDTIALGQVLPQSVIASGDHRVTRVQRVGVHRLAFDIESEAAGSVSAVSIPLALVRIQEAQALAQAINQFRSDTRQRADENRGQISVRGDSLAEIVTSPLSTTSEVVGQFSRNVGQTFEELGRFPGPRDADGTVAEAAPDDPILASHRRSVAGQLGLDVHSSSPAVQRFLWAMARARAGGQARAGITTVSITRPEVAVGGGQVQERVRTTVLNEERGALFERDTRLLDEAGVAPEIASAMLEHPVLTPTHKSALTEYVVFLEGVKNRGALVETALDAQDEVDALGKVQAARMYAWYHESFTPLRELVPGGSLAVGVNRDGALLVSLPFDVLSWTPQSERVFTSLAEFAARKQATDRIVLLTGIATERAEAALEALEFRVLQRFLFRR